MSKEDHGCKVTSVCKHKERKPKKPHYIPRPWGKPYNYKCFQCPFTCMEKSHLYNHMKYSLCKNSLSLLIESDWPYKKGNILHPDQLRPLQQAHGLHGPTKHDPEPATGSEERPRVRRALDGEGEEGESPGGEEEEEEGGQVDGAETAGSNRESGSDDYGGNRESFEATAKKAKRAESELLMADMFSLEDQLLRARSVEVEAQLKHYKLSKACLAAPALLSEQWRLLTSGHAKAKADGAQPRVGPASIPCYPPPPGLLDYQDPTGLNLSVLGVGYPLSPGLFSYVNSIPTAAASANGVTSSGHAQLAQLPFLASAAQLMHPASHPHADRTLLPPRFYYPFLCEHAFGTASAQAEAGKGLKTPASGSDPPGYQPKVSLWKVPALRPVGTAAASPASWPPRPQGESPEPGYRPGEKPQAAAKDGKAGWGLKRTGGPIVGGHGGPPAEKKAGLGFSSLDLLRNAQPVTAVTEKLLLHSSFPSSQPQSHQIEQWYSNPPGSPSSASSSPPPCNRPNGQDCTTSRVTGESASALLNDLSKALQEYQEAERRISHLEKEDLPAQGPLWEHLSKIRSELSHIHQALERTARQSEGPLDLSVKKDPALTDIAGADDQGIIVEDGSLKDDATSDTEEEDEEEEEADREKDGRESEETERRVAKALLESRKQSLDMLIKMSQAGVAGVKTEVLSPGPLGLRGGGAEALWPGRTTKCEADSSVLLGPDGRPAIFADIPTAAVKHLKRPPSIQRLGDLHSPPSPLAATDS